MTSEGTINAQHPKNVGVIIRTMERGLNPPKDAKIVA
jgi:hypothetical protein